MKRILFASWYTGLGGGETDLLTLAESLDASRYEPHLLLPSDGKLGERWRALCRKTHIIPYRGATVWFVPQLWSRFPVVRRFARLIEAERIELVHSDYHTLPLMTAAARQTGIPLAWTVHGWWFKPKIWQRGYFRRIPSVARSRVIRDGFLGAPPFMPAERMPVIYSGVNTERFHPELDSSQLRQELHIQPEAKIIAMAARFQRVKGHQVFQAMAEQVARQEPAARFIVAGDDVFGVVADERYRDEMLAKADGSPLLRERLHYIGFRDDVERVYAAADVVVCASDFESYGKANLEAMACGKPVVSTRRGGPAETVIDGETGFLVDAGDADGLARQVIRLLRDAELRQQVGQVGREHVKRHFSAVAAAAAYTQVFEDLLRGHKP